MVKDPQRVDALQGTGRKTDQFQHHIKHTFTGALRAKENSAAMPIRERLATALRPRRGLRMQRAGNAPTLRVSVESGHTTTCHRKALGHETLGLGSSLPVQGSWLGCASSMDTSQGVF